MDCNSNFSYRYNYKFDDYKKALEDIKEISAYCKGKIETQCQGYYPMTYSKRPLLETYYKKFKLKGD